MKTRSKFTLAAAVSTLAFMAGCAGGGYNPYGAQAGLGGAMGGGAQNTGGDLQGVLLNAIIQSMAASVLNGQIGSQLGSADQNFRLQQLSGVTQSGAFGQAQQWLNPQTGNSLSLTPIGQAVTDPASGQNCRALQEVVTLKNGRTLSEARRACQNASGQWVLTQ